jgi:hypothetical protein
MASSRSADKTPMMAMTVKSSTKEKARGELNRQTEWRLAGR